MAVNDDSSFPAMETTPHSWSPNFFMAKNPSNQKYFGNVIGNVPKEDQIQMVKQEGAEQKTEIMMAGETELEKILPLAEKYFRLWSVINDVYRAILSEFGGAAVLDQSILDITTVLG